MSVNLEHAMNVFNAEGIDIRANFYTLRASQVGVIVDLAKQSGYRRPKNANGSTGRYYFSALQRAYNREED